MEAERGSAAGLRLWIIDPSLTCPETQGVQEILAGWTGTVRHFQPALRPGDGPGPDTGHDTDGVVLLGSAASVHDDLRWLTPLGAWLRPILDGTRRIPLLGVCFGHQLIAHLARGAVDWIEPTRTKIVGVERTRVNGGRLLDGATELSVVVSHREEVKRAPPGYRVTATRPHAPIDGLEHRDLPIFSYQFHPEARDEFAERAGFEPALIDARVREDSRRVISAFLAQLPRS